MLAAAICLLAALTLWSYWPVHSYDFVNFDDPFYVTDNPVVKGGLTENGVRWAMTAFHANNWHPLTWISLMADCQLFGLAPAAMHSVNLAWHILSASLLLIFLYLCTRQLPESFLVAGVFALHPTHVESVAWISERKDVLCAAFWFLTLLAYRDYVRLPSVGRYLALGLLFVLALLAKPFAVTLPFVLLLLDYWPLGRTRYAAPAGAGSVRPPVSLRHLFVEKIPLFALSAGVCILTCLAQRARAIIPLNQVPMSLRLANSLTAYARYIGKLFWPEPMAVLYPLPQAIPAWQWFGAALLVAALSAGAILFRKRFPWLFTGWFWFLGTLIPVIGLVQVGSQSMADRYTYLPFVGLAIPVAWGLAAIGRHLRIPPVAAAAACGIALGLCAIDTRHQVGYWHDTVTLFRHGIDSTTDNAVLCKDLGVTFVADGNNEAALAEYRRACAMRPNYEEGLYRLGDLLLKTGRLDEAEKTLRRTIDLKPDAADAHLDLGTLLLQKKDTAGALREISYALLLAPNLSSAHDAMGRALTAEGKDGQAFNEYAAAVKCDPNDLDAQTDLGEALMKRGSLQEAMVRFRAVLAADPKHAQAMKNLASALDRAGDFAESCKVWERLLEVAPDSPGAHAGYSAALLHRRENEQGNGGAVTPGEK